MHLSVPVLLSLADDKSISPANTASVWNQRGRAGSGPVATVSSAQPSATTTRSTGCCPSSTLHTTQPVPAWRSTPFGDGPAPAHPLKDAPNARRHTAMSHPPSQQWAYHHREAVMRVYCGHRPLRHGLARSVRAHSPRATPHPIPTCPTTDADDPSAYGGRQTALSANGLRRMPAQIDRVVRALDHQRTQPPSMLTRSIP